MGVSLLALAPACGGEEPEGPVGAYAFLAEDAFDAEADWDPLVMCRDDEPCSPAGFLSGIVFAAKVRDHDKGYGIAIEFDSITEEELTILRDHARELSLSTFVLLDEGDVWPYCEGEPGCLTVGETP